MKKKQDVYLMTSFILFFLIFIFAFNNWIQSKNFTSDDVLLAIIKNDIKAFENFLDSGGNIYERKLKIDGRTLAITEAVIFFERFDLIRLLHSRKVSLISNGEYDTLAFAIQKNSPELMRVLTKEDPDLKLTYGPKAWSLLHMAGFYCADKIIPILDPKNQSWNRRSKDGSTPLTLAAESGCRPILSFWKKSGANFRQIDGRGKSAQMIIRSKNDPDLFALTETSKGRGEVAFNVIKSSPNFYRKRKIPKDQVVDHSELLSPEDRPLEATKTAEFSEFSD